MNKINLKTKNNEILSLILVIHLLLAFLLTPLVGTLIIVIVALAFTVLKENIYTVLAFGISIISVICLVLFNVILKHFNTDWAQIGFRRPNLRILHLLWQVPLIFVVLIAVQAVVVGMTGAELASNENVTDRVQLNAHLLAVIPFVLSMVVIVPLLEETLFRGAIYSLIRKNRGVLAGVVVSAIIFAFGHFVPILLPYYLTLGIGLAALYEFHETLWAPLILHSILNTFVTITLYLAISN